MENQNLSTSSFKRFFLFIAVILFAVSLVCVCSNTLFEDKIIFASKIGGASKVNRILNHTFVGETPIFGSSRAQGGYVPSILGENFFNYGMDGIQSDIWLFFLKHELFKDKHTPIIINFDLCGFVGLTGNLGSYIPNYSETEQLLNPSAHSFHYHLPFIRYSGKFELYVKYFLNEKTNFTKHTDNGGSFEKNVMPEELFSQLVEQRKNTPQTFTGTGCLADSFFALTAQTDRKIILVVAPYHRSFFESMTNLAEARLFLKTVDENYENIKVFDFSAAFCGDSLFYDTTHLTYRGAQLFSSQLRDSLNFLSNN
jgi:hypothetical protein